eukprot:gene23122-biopygen8829
MFPRPSPAGGGAWMYSAGGGFSNGVDSPEFFFKSLLQLGRQLCCGDLLLVVDRSRDLGPELWKDCAKVWHCRDWYFDLLAFHTFCFVGSNAAQAEDFCLVHGHLQEQEIILSKHEFLEVFEFESALCQLTHRLRRQFARPVGTRTLRSSRRTARGSQIVAGGGAMPPAPPRAATGPSRLGIRAREWSPRGPSTSPPSVCPSWGRRRVLPPQREPLRGERCQSMLSDLRRARPMDLARTFCSRFRLWFARGPGSRLGCGRTQRFQGR